MPNTQETKFYVGVEASKCVPGEIANDSVVLILPTVVVGMKADGWGTQRVLLKIVVQHGYDSIWSMCQAAIFAICLALIKDCKFRFGIRSQT